MKILNTDYEARKMLMNMYLFLLLYKNKKCKNITYNTLLCINHTLSII